MKLSVKELTVKTWDDFETLFGERGACGGCWCMWWRLKKSEFNKNKGPGNKQKMKTFVESGTVPGLIFYSDKKPIAWCSVAPREEFPLLENSRVLKRIDEERVWSVVCLFILKEYRRIGLSSEILKTVIKYVKKKKGKIIEGYPFDPRKDNLPAPFLWTGIASAYIKAGFEEVKRRSETRPIMRFYI